MSILIHSRDCLKPYRSHLEDPTTHVLKGDLCPASLGHLSATLILLPPGTRIIPRAHSHSSVFVYVLSGSGICWHHGSPYEMSQNDCVGFRGGSGLGFAFINDGHAKEPLEFLMLSEDHADDKVQYFLTSSVSFSEYHRSFAPDHTPVEFDFNLERWSIAPIRSTQWTTDVRKVKNRD